MLDVSEHFGPNITIFELLVGFIDSRVTSSRVIESSGQDLMPYGDVTTNCVLDVAILRFLGI